MGEETDVRGGTSAVDFSSVRKIRPPRLLASLSVGVLYLALAAVCWAGSRFGRTFSDIDLPVPAATGLLLQLTRFLQTPAGIALAALSFLCVILLVVRGTLDRFLKGLLILNVLVIGGLVVWAFAGLLFPLYDLIPALRKK